MGDVGEPGDVPAGRPREGIPVAVRWRHPAREGLTLLRVGAVSLPVHHPAALVPEGTLWVLAGGVLGVVGGAARDVEEGSGSG